MVVAHDYVLSGFRFGGDGDDDNVGCRERAKHLSSVFATESGDGAQDEVATKLV